jgi:hypothetical protein
MKKFEAGTLQTYASLRFSGDRLEPQRLTQLLNTRPEIAYRKGEVYKISRGHEVRGRTGLWVISSKGIVASPDLNEHLDHLLGVLFSDGSDSRLNRLHKLMCDDGIEADAPCFWYGQHGAKPPVIRDEIRARLAQIPAEIWADFDTD